VADCCELDASIAVQLEPTQFRKSRVQRSDEMVRLEVTLLLTQRWEGDCNSLLDSALMDHFLTFNLPNVGRVIVTVTAKCD
jgi:hypothetical protein